LSTFYGIDPTRTIKNGMDYNLVISYQPLQFIDFGIFANYQYASLRRPLRWIYQPDPIYPDSTLLFEGTNYIETNAFSAGLSTHLYINKLLHFDQNKSKILKNLQLSAGFMGGVGFSTLMDRSAIYYQAYHGDSKNYQYKATNFHGRVELGVGYRLGKTFFSDVGIKIGYQFFKTSELKNYVGSYLHPSGIESTKGVQLNFSGVYYGIYFKIGK
jgi:hypothetical protein